MCWCGIEPDQILSDYSRMALVEFRRIAIRTFLRRNHVLERLYAVLWSVYRSLGKLFDHVLSILKQII